MESQVHVKGACEGSMWGHCDRPANQKMFFSCLKQNRTDLLSEKARLDFGSPLWQVSRYPLQMQ